MIKRYSQFVFERRDVESREKVSASSRICSFLKKHGFKYEGSISESIEELFDKPSSDGNTRRGLNDEYSLMTLLRAFQESYVEKVMEGLPSLNKGKMTLYLYRGDLQRPMKVLMSSFGL